MDHDRPTGEGWNARQQYRERLDIGGDPLRMSDIEPDRGQGSGSAAWGYAEHDDAHMLTEHPPNAPFRHRLDSQASDLDSPGEHEDDEHLTSSRRVSRYEGQLSPQHGRGRSLRESVGSGGGRALSALGKTIRRASVRVVNVSSVAGVGMRGQDRPDERVLSVAPPPNNRDGIVLRIQVPTGVEDEAPLPEMRGPQELRGRTLCFFGPTNPLRLAMQKLLLWTWTEPFILILIFANAVVLTIQSSHSFSSTELRPTGRGYFHEWEDYVLFGLFVLFTLEAFARIIVTGLFIDPEIPFTSLRISFNGITQGSISNRLQSIKPHFTEIPEHLAPDPMHRPPRSPRFGPSEKFARPLSPLPTLYPPGTHPNLRARSADDVNTQDMHSRAGTSKLSLSHNVDLPFQLAIQKQRDLIKAARPYLRHSWNRVDAVAIISFWITFCLSMFGLERTSNRHLYIFRALSVLRTARLLAVSSGTATILRSLKKAAPRLANVAFVVLFAMVLFSIIGVQLFQGNFRRACVVESNPPIVLISQLCGGQIDPVTLNATGFFQANGNQMLMPKGYICPLGQRCLQQTNNPHSNIEHFDNVLAAALEIFIIASTNGWAPLMYSMMDADYFVACFFFFLCVIILNFWLINLFVGVITSTFSNIRAETNRSAFGAETDMDPPREKDWDRNGGRWRIGEYMKKVYDKIYWVFALLAAASVGVQGVKTVTTPQSRLNEYLNVERAITVVFDIEILWRFIATSPQWRNFIRKKRNIADLVLALVCTIIIIPPIPNTEAYKWLTAFQLARFYRAILIVPGMHSLLYKVFGNSKGLFNTSVFLLLANFLAALFAIQLFRGDVDSNGPLNFLHVGSAFLAMYQVLSSENWTDILWSTSDSEDPFHQQWIAILLVAGWLFFANFILLQMFIALINENFEVAEEQKQELQMQDYIRRAGPTAKVANWVDRFNPYLRSLRRSDPKIPGTERAKRGKSILHPKKPSHSHNRAGSIADEIERVTIGIGGMGSVRSALVAGPLGTMRRFMGMDQQQEDVPLMTWNTRHTVNLTDITQPFAPVPVKVKEASEYNHLSEQRARRAITVVNHPSYDKSLWIFSQNNSVRRFCQQFVPPSNDDNEERTFGRPPSPLLEFCFRAIMLLVVVAGIIVEAVATPIYRSAYYAQYGTKIAWFDIAEAVFGFLLIVEFIVKIIADGFIFTPNAYLLNTWNIVDGVILMAVLVNVCTTLIVVGGISHLTRALKAFRALRLITLIGWMRGTFHSVIFAGARRMLDAAVLAILYMIPYAVWGLNIFSGMMYSCNDPDSAGKSDCEGIFLSTPVNNSLGFYAPRVWSNPTPSTHFSFDTFGDSLLILFEIVSLEGWIEVLKAALGVTGKDQQPRTNASQINAIFFLLYNLLGAVVILTLFVSIIIANFSTRSGMALLTVEQRQWVGLQKLAKRQRPSKRPKLRPRSPFRSWCFDRATQKHGWWSRMMTVFYVAYIGVLMSQTFHSTQGALLSDRIRDSIFMGFAAAFLSDLLIQFVGLGWKSFRANGWNIFDSVVVLGSIFTTALLFIGVSGSVPRQAQKLFLVCVAFKLVQKLDSLNRLFKTAVSSLGAITKLFGLWFVLFLFFGMLFIEIFALTKWGSGETYNQNYQSLGSALVMLAFMSTGEGWNQYMHDYAIEYPRCTNSNLSIVIQSDCGSRAWSFTLSILWNILSMFIFVNMFTGIVVENFSYVYQQQGTESLTREQMRGFKKTWAEFDPESTGYLRRDKIGPFLGRLSGIFEVRVYPPEYRVKNLVAASTIKEVTPLSPLPTPDTHVEDLSGFSSRKLDSILSQIDYEVIRHRRQTFDHLYWEARVTDDHGKGISFTSMLLLLCHYKLIDDDQALKLNELVRRRMVTEHVHDLVNLDRVRSLLRMTHHRRRFLAHLKRRRENELQKARAGLPEIIVAEAPVTPFQSWDITTGDNPDPLSPDPGHNVFTISSSPRVSESGWSDPASPRSHHHRASDFNLSSLEPGFYYADSSSIGQQNSDGDRGF